MRPLNTLLQGSLIVSVMGSLCAYSQTPTGKITSIGLNQNPVMITYDLIGAADEEYDVVVFIMKENDAGSMMKLEMVKGDVGTGKFAGIGRQILWDKNELGNPQEGARYQFALKIYLASEGGLPWYVYPGAVVAGVAVWLAIKKPPPPEIIVETKQIPSPPDRP